jgi:dimethylglycine catabolism A
MTLSEPHLSDALEGGDLEIVQVYTGEVRLIADVAFFAYSTPRVPDVSLAAPLAARGIDVRLIGDCRAPRNLMSATAEGHAAGHEL